ncbi:MAG: ATP-binding protein, partial [Clostridiales bacterium]|nr:ATP-binding protein [Clostridiales bacterium]
ALISFCINVIMQNQFKNYVIKQQEIRNEELVSLVKNQYNSSDSSWNMTVIENIGINALEQGVIMKVKDEKGNTVWDATIHNNGLCVQMLNHMANNMQSRYPNFEGGYEQQSYPIMINSKEVGVVEAGYYGPYYFTDNDINFLNNINRILIVLGMLFLLMAFLVGAFMAKRISGPISKSITAAGEIAKGNYKQRIVEKSGTREIVQLTETINYLADSLEKQEGLRKRMSADVAHELRTPLANLQSSLEAMIDGVWEANGDRLESCHEEIMRINRLVGDLEKLSRFEAENTFLNISEFDAFELIQRILNNFEPEFHKKKVEMHFLGNKVNINADKDKISQVLINLISNSLKYTPSGGRVDVMLSSEDQDIQFVIKDTGEGISKEDLPFIFERFYRADQSRSRLTGGSGLGLSITKAIIESHKGKIDVKSKIGEGTTFTVSLPKFQ